LFKMNRFLLVAIALLAIVALIAGCGGAKEEPKDQAKEPQASSKGTLVIGSDTAYAPFEWQDTATGKYIGFDMDLIDAVCKEAGYDYKVQSMTFDGLIPALVAGTIDASISAMTIKPERAEQVNFTDPYYKSGLIIAVKSDNDSIKSFDDLKGKKLGVQLGTTGADMARTVEGAKVTDYDRIPEAFLALKQGTVDAVVNDAPVTLYAIKQDGKGDIKVVGDMLSSEYYGIAVPKSKPDLYKDLNEALARIKQNGKFAELYEKWFGQAPPEELMTMTVQQAIEAYGK